MYSRLYSSNSLVARSQNNKNQNIVDFSTLSETEKRRYVQLLQKNKVDVEKDPNDNLYVAHIKVVKQQHLEQEINDSMRSYTPDLPHDSSMSRSFSKQDMHNNTRAKSEMRDRSFQATNRSIERESSREKPKFTSVTPDDTKKTLTKARNMKSTEQLINREAMEQYRSTRDISPSSSMKKLHQNDRSRAYENSSPEQSRLERRFTQRSKSPISDCTKECYNYYFDFCQLANMANCVNYLRPKKIPLESLNKIVEEIFSLQFVQGTSMVKAVVSRKLDYDGSPGNSFAAFVLKYLKERTRNLPRAVEQNVLNLAYSVYWFRKKSPEVELFSRFLSGEASDDDLTFFLFLRFSTEKEINVSLPNYPASPSNITMSVRSCYRILEIIYGKYQKELLNDLTQKIKDFIFEERERRHDFAFEGIPVYSFLYITFEDYFFNKQRCRDNIAFETEDIINETAEEKEESHRDIIYYSASKDKFSQNQYATSNWQSAEKRPANPTAAPPRNSKVSITEGDDNKKALKTSGSNKTYQKYVKPIEKPTSLNILAPVPSQDNSPGHRKKRVGSSEAQGFSSTTSSTGNLDFLQEFCVNMMLEKINEFIDVALFERKNVKESHKEFVKVKLLDIFKRKFNNIIKALFSFDKMKWLDALLIDDPTNAQLQNVEVLQKELRELRKLTLEALDKQAVMVFTNRILRTPELSVQIGRLILEFDYDETAGNRERP